MSLFPEAMAGTMDSGPGTLAGADPSPTPTPNPTSAPPPTPDLVLQHAYRLAAQDGNTAAMSAIHGKLLNYYQTQTAKMAQQNEEDRGTWDNLRAGTGRGLERVVKGVGNLVGLESDEDLAQSDKNDQALLSTTGGKVGDVVGQVAATLPLSLAGGAAVGGATKALPWLGRGAQGLGTRAAVAGAEGAAGAQLGGGDAEEGGADAAGLSVLGSAGGKLVRGLVGKSKDYQHLQQLAEDPDLFVPISQGGTGAAKGIYQHVLPYALGVEQQLDSQAGKASKQLEDVAARKAMPFQVDPADGKGEMMEPKIGETMQQTAADIKSQYEQAYQNTVKSYAFNLPDDVEITKKGKTKTIPGVVANVREQLSDAGLPKAHVDQIAELMDNTLAEHSNNGVITGENLLRAKQAARQALGSLRSPTTGANIADEGVTKSALGVFDDIVQNAIDENKSIASAPVRDKVTRGVKTGAVEADRPGAADAPDATEYSKPQTQQRVSGKDRRDAVMAVNDLENYQRLSPQVEEANAVARTAEANKPNRGELKWNKLANESPDGTQMQDLGQTAHSVLENESPGSVNPAGRHALHTGEAALGAAGLGASFLGHPAGLGIIGAANLAATKTAQRALYGDTNAQRAMADILRRNPKAARLGGALIRQGVTDDASEP